MERKIKCERCHLDLQPEEIYMINYSKKPEEYIVLCESCMRFVSGLITAAVDDIIEEYILRED